jgi:hypothetical protein
MVLTNVGTTDYGIGFERECIIAKAIMRGEFQIFDLKHERITSDEVISYRAASRIRPKA